MFSHPRHSSRGEIIARQLGNPATRHNSSHKNKPILTAVAGPYSKFRVGACILTASGEFVVGANVENVSYPVGTCAERVAFATAIVC